MANIIKQIFSGEVVKEHVSRYLPFIVFIVVLLNVYIGFRYHIENTVKDISTLSKDISDLQKHYLQVKTSFQRTSQMTFIDSKLSSTGVAISKEPIRDIIIYEPQKQEDEQ